MLQSTLSFFFLNGATSVSLRAHAPALVWKSMEIFALGIFAGHPLTAAALIVSRNRGNSRLTDPFSETKLTVTFVWCVYSSCTANSSGPFRQDFSVYDSFIKMGSMPFHWLNANASAAFSPRCSRWPSAQKWIVRFCGDSAAKKTRSLNAVCMSDTFDKKNIFHLSLSLWRARAHTRTFPF